MVEHNPIHVVSDYPWKLSPNAPSLTGAHSRGPLIAVGKVVFKGDGG